jgi:MoaA/NifB/PqqE/SkfB family radical SAM enzyme
MAALCCENGMVPVLCATGSVCRGLAGAVSEDIKACADRYFIEETMVRDDCDFAEIDVLCEKLGVDLLIGSSDARRIAARRGIDLVRCAFPIHDFVGGQRARTLGYSGSLSILDQCANFRIAREDAAFRQDAYDKYYDGEKKIAPAPEKEPAPGKTIEERTASHPCFNGCAQSCARIHLPVAPKCNIQCNYCVRKFDCVNESRPGVTTRVLSPEEALLKYLLVKKQVPNLTVAGIAGPGDSLANWPETKKTLELIRREDPEVTFCLSTNGLMLPVYARELYELGVTHVTVTMNAVDPAVGGRIYRFVDYMGTRFRGEAAASVLLANQMTGIRMLADLGIVVKVNIVTLKTVNDRHIREVTQKARELGAYITNIMPHILVEGSDFENLPTLSNKELIALRKECGEDILQMHHCRQCRADAVGTLDHDLSLLFDKEERQAKPPAAEKKKCAVASESGMFVDKHFGQAEEFYIYESDGREVRFLEKRGVKQYCSGQEHCGETERAPAIQAVSDCDCVLAMRIGDQPARTLGGMGIQAVTVFDGVEKAVLSAAASLKE